MSILHLEKIDMTYLDTRERAIIDDSESRRFKVNEEGARKRASSDSPYSLSVRKRPREGDESDEEEASTTELPKDGLESR